MIITSMVSPEYPHTAREFDSETGLYYYRARYYDAKAGRFIQRDPIKFKGGINLYTYAKNNPATLTDPTGLTVKLCKRDLDLCDPSNPFCPSSTGANSQYYHAFISVNHETFGLEPQAISVSRRCWVEGPGFIAWNKGVDQLAEIEGYMHGSCQSIECPCEQELLDGLRTAVAPYFCLKPGSGINCQVWASMMLGKYCNNNN